MGDSLTITPSDNGGFAAQHSDGATHVFSDLPGLAEHVQDHFGSGEPVYKVKGSKPVPLVPGNVDLYHRPHVKNPDGSISTLYSASYDLDTPFQGEGPRSSFAGVGKGHVKLTHIVPLEPGAGLDTPGAVVLIPRVLDDVPGGRIGTAKEAFEYYKKTGKHLGIYKNRQDADKMSLILHNEGAENKYGDFPSKKKTKAQQ